MNAAPHAIDAKTGRVTFESPQLSLSAALTLDAFEASPGFARFEAMNRNPPWALFGFRDFEAARERWAGLLSFREDPIQWITLIAQRPELGTSWADFSTQKERARQALHNEWLAAQLGEPPPTRTQIAGVTTWEWAFPWGHVHSGWDVKNGTTEIVVSYGRRGERGTER